MPTPNKILDNELRALYMSKVAEYLTNADEQVLITGSNEIAVPCVDGMGNEKYLVITFKIPTGTRDGEAYNGFHAAEDYAIKQQAKAEKARAQAEKKAKKIARDMAKREEKKESE